MTKFLITGFEPFAGRKTNASWEIAAPLDGQEINGWEIVCRRLPVKYNACQKALETAIHETGAEHVIALGEAYNRSEMCIEVRGQNIARGTDEDGTDPGGRRLEMYGPDERIWRGDVDLLLLAGRSTGVPLKVSRDAGHFLCNSVLYDLLGRVVLGELQSGLLIHCPLAPADSHGLVMGIEIDKQRETLVAMLRAWILAHQARDEEQTWA